MLDKDNLHRAQELVYAHMQPTSTLSWPLLSAEVGVQTWVKHENQTPIGAFKLRGGLVYLHELSKRTNRQNPPLLVTATRGNHGQSIPYAANLYGLKTRVYVPHGNSLEKNAAMRAWGADVREHGADFDAARAQAESDAEQPNVELVPSFHEHLIQGVATYAAELFDQVHELKRVYVPIGMGSGACAVLEVRDLMSPHTEVIGVVSSHADAMAQSFAQGKIVHTATAHTFADGVATRMPNPLAFDRLRRGLTRLVCVTDDEVAAAMRILYQTTHNVAEGAGAAATAALLQDQSKVANGETDLALNSDAQVAVILTGGNIDQGAFAKVLGGGVPGRD